MISNLRNWAGNYFYRAAQIHQPETAEQIRELVSNCVKLKALGTRHSFNDIADSSGDVISLEQFDKILGLDHKRCIVTVKAGLRYGNLATAVLAMELVTGTGELAVLSREHDREEFEGAVIGLGGLGVVTKLTLDVSPTFQMQQDVYEDLPLAELEKHFDDLTSEVYSLFTDWRDSRFNQVWLKRHLPDGVSVKAKRELFGAPLLVISEVRIIAADNLWMGLCHQQACLAIHFMWKQDWAGVRDVSPLIEEKLEPFDARPHWGKLFTGLHQRLQSLYEKMQDFRALLQRDDLQGKFRNGFLDKYIFGIS